MKKTKADSEKVNSERNPENSNKKKTSKTPSMELLSHP